MSDNQPITIRSGPFTCTIYQIGKLLELPLKNIRKLCKIIFSAVWENEETIGVIRVWLPAYLADTGNLIDVNEDNVKQAASEAESLRRTVSAFGSVATKEQKAALIAAGRKVKAAEKALKTTKSCYTKAQKTQAIFNEMSIN